MNTEFINLYHQQVFFLRIWNPLFCKLVPFVHSVLMPLKPTSFAKCVSPEIPGLVNFSAEKFTIISIPKLNFMERNHLIARNDTLGTLRKIKTRPPFVWFGAGGHFNTCVIFWYPESSHSLSFQLVVFHLFLCLRLPQKSQCALGDQIYDFSQFPRDCSKKSGSFPAHQKESSEHGQKALKAWQSWRESKKFSWNSLFSFPIFTWCFAISASPVKSDF